MTGPSAVNELGGPVIPGRLHGEPALIILSHSSLSRKIAS